MKAEVIACLDWRQFYILRLSLFNFIPFASSILDASAFFFLHHEVLISQYDVGTEGHFCWLLFS